VDKDLVINIFTKSPQTIYGVSALALSTNHPLLSQITPTDRQAKANEFCSA